jgi:hypothetical protein
MVRASAAYSWHFNSSHFACSSQALRLQRKQADEALGIVEDEAVSARETLARHARLWTR